MAHLFLAAAAAWLAACSPDLNWRDVGFDGSNLKVQLPCKPDRVTRPVPLGGHPVQLQVAGCQAGSAMVAIMTANLPAGADPNALMQGWQQATLSNIEAKDVHAQPWERPGMLPLPAAQRIAAQGVRSDGQPVAAQAVWGAIIEGEHVRLVHATVYDRKIGPELASTLFDGIRP